MQTDEYTDEHREKKQAQTNKPTVSARLAALHREARHLEIDLEEDAPDDLLTHMRRAVSALGRAVDAAK